MFIMHPEGNYPITYSWGFTANTGPGAGVAEDTGFGGTSGMPVAPGFISTVLGTQ